jgi:hypothetical protein
MTQDVMEMRRDEIRYGIMRRRRLTWDEMRGDETMHQLDVGGIAALLWSAPLSAERGSKIGEERERVRETERVRGRDRERVRERDRERVREREGGRERVRERRTEEFTAQYSASLILNPYSSETSKILI